MKRTFLMLALTAAPTAAFAPITSSRDLAGRRSTELYGVIPAEEVSSTPFDIGQGGVRLTEESVIKITGDVKHKPGSAEARAQDLTRYTKLTEVAESNVQDILQKSGGKIISTGQGIELYKDPGETLETIVKLAPVEAIKEAVNGAASAMESQTLVFNFFGGDDLMLGEVLDAANEMVVMMDIVTNAKISFNSVCHESAPKGSCSVSVISVAESDETFVGTQKPIAAGEVYVRDGVWYTLDEADLNSATA